ncbi:sodium-translocating pyrophosphatase [Spirochaeta isovalerica]|uniref:Putative K(+)-stimulated pyrophosphate-energized sodium pump n=1 Tax=Spirochaeta isovalerica TaxID=150 RepID=A0A841RDW2_9SPIO|nr:sodium-translocating pyrophosphatase [Spirochaeta isovalerica]MBB6482173.1 K(+)-stimulated pyrophosphate-energized sodium pump [Spirochaeta isovalerica]
MNPAVLSALLIGLFFLIIAVYRALWIFRQPVKEGKIKEISYYISEGAMAFLKREYIVLIPFILIIALLLLLGNKGVLKWQVLSFILGSTSSALAGYIGMKVATASNSRTVTAAEEDLNSALKVAFTGGSIMGLSVAGLAVLGIFVVLFTGEQLFGFETTTLRETVLPILTGFSLGASTVALFARVGGGIFTKAADVGADLVGKVEAGIPEDDPRNPAVIADNVGDNVGDVAGMGADLFESFIGSLIGAMILGINAPALEIMQRKLVFFPLYMIGIGGIASVAGMMMVRIKKGISPQKALNRGSFGAAVLTVAILIPFSLYFFGTLETNDGTGVYQILLTSVLGLIAGVAIGLITEYFTGTEKKPVIRIVKSCETGSATNLIAGLGVGMQSTMMPILIIAGTILGSYFLAGFYGIGISALGMLMTVSIQLAVDAYGPIADNAGGLAVMGELSRKVRERTDSLDAVGNTTAAVGKGFAIGSAALTSIILFASFQKAAGLSSIDLMNPAVLAGILVGSMIPYLFSSLAMDAVGKAAFAMIKEVRRQFNENPGILKGTALPDYKKCIDISTKSALTQMALPGLIATAVPVLTGFFGGAYMLAGILVGVTASGVLMATFMSNSGGAWDNAKKMLEADNNIDKSSETYKASVVGDTVGDPFKDTAGPSLNILIKLMAVISLVIAPML